MVLLIKAKMDQDQRWTCNIKKWINEGNCDPKRVRVLNKLIHSIERQSGLQRIDENITRNAICPPLRAKIATLESPKIPKIVAVHPKKNNNLNSSDQSAISYGVFLSAASEEPSYDSPIIFDEETNFYTAFEDLDESDQDRTYYNVSKTNTPVEEQKENFMRHSTLSKSCRLNNGSNKKSDFVRRNSLRSTKREITKKFVVNLYESRMPENKDNNMENKKIYEEPIYAVPMKKNRTVKDTNTQDNKEDIVVSPKKCQNNVHNDRLPVKSFDEKFNKEILSRDVYENNIDNEYAVLDISASTDSGFSENNSHKENTDLFPELKQRADVQGHIMKQASSALTVLRKKNNHQPAPGELVAEKILLISSYTHEAILQEIRQNQYENFGENEERHTASLSISGLNFNLENNVIDDNHNFYFICICSQGSTVYATETVEAQPGQKSITFHQTFGFDYLDAEFILKVNVYFLKLRKSYGKFGFNKVRACCTPPRRVLYKDSYSYNVVETEILSSSFACCGSIQVQIGDLKRGSLKLDKLPRNSPLTGTTDLKVTVTKMDINTNRSGFLTVGTPKNNNIVWNRMWCKIKGPNLKFWNYPSDEHINPPVISIDMRKILSNPVDFAKRCQCPRPRTLHLEVEDEQLTYKTPRTLTPLVKNNMQMGYYKMVEYYLSADTQADIEGWKEKLNSIIKFLKLWNTTEKNTYL